VPDVFLSSEPIYFEPPKPSRRRGWVALAASLIAFLLIIVIVLFMLPNLLSFGNLFFVGGDSGGQTSTYFVSPGGNGSDLNSSILSSKVEISYPQDYAQLLNYSLGIINENRTSLGLSAVTVSPIPSAQQHADSMLQNGYFSHWDTQGLKPYMRYSLLNGTGFVEENVAYEYTTFPSFITAQSVEKVIGLLEWQMMNNDSQCCQNGHRGNILNPYHNRVSIGIAYDATHVYFVEDFETSMANLTTPVYDNGTVVLEGNTVEPLKPTSVFVFYDNTPASLTPEELNTVYYGPYDQGTFIGGVVPPCQSFLNRCLQFAQGITEQASTWQVNSTAINIRFSLSSFANDAAGVYTIYLVQGSESNPEYLTSISIFSSG
jgi:uncharacterized protein YkwD